jgi:hypothetical protein
MQREGLQAARIPKGFNLSAQGCGAAATLGTWINPSTTTLKELHPSPDHDATFSA